MPTPARRRASGYRDYGPEVVGRLRFARRAKDLRFTLKEIRELMALSTDRERSVAAAMRAGKGFATRIRADDST